MAYPFLIQGNNIVVVIGNKSHTISKTHITYNKVLEAIKAQDWDLVKDTIEPKKVVLNYGQGNISVQGETLYWKGKELHNTMTSRVISMLQDGFPVEPMVNFMENLYANPSKRAVDELYGFLEKNQLPITPDGHFLAYKKVRANYFDVHSGTMDNSVGKIVEMARNEVDDNKDRTCSSGLHFCGMSYLNHFGGERIMIVKINPADVVSIPTDYNEAKGRACRYEVIGELNAEEKVEDAFTEVVQSNANTVVRPAVKTGDSAFYRGYEAGYTSSVSNVHAEPSFEDVKKYNEGYTKGIADASINTRRYQLVNAPRAAWTPVV
jgi:hypothetical protein